MLNDLNIFNDTARMTDAVKDAKELFGENLPFFQESRLGETIIIFNEHFIRCVREALSNGCMAKMNEEEERLFNQFIEYQDGSSYRDISKDSSDIMTALDKWLVNAIQNVPNPVLNDCYTKKDHTW